MKKFLEKVQPKDVIALVGLVGCIALMALGKNHVVTDIFAGIIVVYVGIDIALIRRKGG